jgi:hypothetical protein
MKNMPKYLKSLREVRINIGDQVGVKKRQRFKFMDEEITLEITSSQPNTYSAKITQGKELLKEGLRGEAI